jgi:hypothetical protein
MEYQEIKDTFARAELANTNQILAMLMRALQEGDETMTKVMTDMANETIAKNEKFLNS